MSKIDSKHSVLGAVHNGQRISAVVEFLRKERGVSRVKFCEAIGINSPSLNHWYNTAKFSQTMWRKLTPALEKYGIDPRYILGYTSEMVLDAEAMDLEKKHREQLLEVLSKILDAVQGIQQYITKRG